jgi:hypothetical protein
MEDERRRTGANGRAWDGPSVRVSEAVEADDETRTVSIELTRGAARDLALMIKRLGQTTMVVEPWIEEIADGIDWVTGGRPPISAGPPPRRPGSLADIAKGMLPEDSAPLTGAEILKQRTDPRLRALRRNPQDPGIALGSRDTELIKRIEEENG